MSNRSFLCTLAGVLLASSGVLLGQDATWPTYGGDAGGQRFSTAKQIDRSNLSQLTPAWTFHTGSLARNRPGTGNSSFEATPILFRGALYFTSPFDDVFALDPATGLERWHYDPDVAGVPHGVVTSRGVAAWPLDDRKPATGTPCDSRIFIATMDARLLALDAASGKPCADFGNRGALDLRSGMRIHDGEEYFFSSPPTVIGDVVVVGSGIGDNQRVDAASGSVRAFDVRTGRQLWSWDPIPWAAGQRLRTGAANAWSIIAADPEHNLLFIPTGAPSPDFYGGERPGDNRDANSVVALEAITGRRVWGFQVVHHDLWDYDIAAEPVLFLWQGKTPAVAVTTKMGLVFVLDRLTGKPLIPVDERAVPASDVPGENASPTQPFPRTDPLTPITLPADAMLSDTPAHSEACRAVLAKLRYNGIYTPPSFQGTVDYPGNLGGVNWGGAAVDPTTGVLYANVNNDIFSLTVRTRKSEGIRNFLYGLQIHYLRFSFIIAGSLAALLLVILLLRRRTMARNLSWVAALSIAVFFLTRAGLLYDVYGLNPNVEHFGRELGLQLGAPFETLHDHVEVDHTACSPLPWGMVAALDLNTGHKLWQTPLGTMHAGQHTGTANLGGGIVTATGLVFTAASREPLLRAFDAATGAELWSGALPAPAQATPMTYTVNGRQFVVIAAGGHGLFKTPLSDSLVAFALPAAH